MSDLDQKASQRHLHLKNMQQAIGILQEAKDKIHIASALIVRHQGQLDKKLKIVDTAIGAVKLLQDEIQKEFF